MNIPYILKVQIKVRNYKAINIPQTQKAQRLETLTFLKHKNRGAKPKHKLTQNLPKDTK